MTFENVSLPSSVTVTLDPPPSAYNNWAFQPILHQHFDHMRARMMDLAESSTRDKKQADAMKALMKDFINTAYFDSLKDIESFCRDKKIISAGEGQVGGQHVHLRSKTIQEFLYEPE